MRLALLLLCIGCGPQVATTETGLIPGTTAGVPGSGGETIRIATWNIEGVGSPGSDEYDALIDVLRRIDADVIGLNEIDIGETSILEDIAAQLGYDTVVVPGTNPFGDIRNGMLARVPVQASTVHSAADISGDSSANDVTRKPVSVTLPSGLQIAVMHCKSGFDDTDEFRRNIDAIRLGQVPSNPAGSIVMGDINHEVDEAQDSPTTFTDIPWDVPGGYFLGGALYDQLVGGGIHNGPFTHFDEAGYAVVEAAQMDGSLATRNESGRRIDYILVGADLVSRVRGSEIYDARDDGAGVGLEKAGDPPLRNVSERAADHLPVFIDLAI